jgi:hypothetical protein
MTQIDEQVGRVLESLKALGIAIQFILQLAWDHWLPVLGAEYQVQQNVRQRLGHGLLPIGYISPFQG